MARLVTSAGSTRVTYFSPGWCAGGAGRGIFGDSGRHSPVESQEERTFGLVGEKGFEPATPWSRTRLGGIPWGHLGWRRIRIPWHQEDMVRRHLVRRWCATCRPIPDRMSVSLPSAMSPQASGSARPWSTGSAKGRNFGAYESAGRSGSTKRRCSPFSPRGSGRSADGRFDGSADVGCFSVRYVVMEPRVDA
jgi:hypothetical protein